MTELLAIEAEGLSRRYGRRWALHDVGFHLRRGESLLLAGRNGSGKSTLLRLLAAAIRPHLGSARIEGIAVADRESVRSRVALLGHHPYLWDSLTARENLDVVARPISAAERSVGEVLAATGLGKREGDRVATFSAGMRKRLMLARVLLQDKPVVLLDEPYGQLDPGGFELIDRLVVDAAQRGKTIVIATHQIARVAALTKLAIVLEKGTIAWSGRSSELGTASEVRSALAEKVTD
jgi:heme exporter protein A